MRKLVLSIGLMSVLLSAVVVLGFAPLQDVDAQKCKPGQNDKNCINGQPRIRNIHNIDQLNEAIAQQNGGDVAQNQLNSATLQGDHFNIHQKNKAVSEGADSSFQNQLNNVAIEGDHNNIHQSNDARSDADNSVILQGNNAQTDGEHNNVHQKNKAQQTGSGSQTVSQTNNADNEGGNTRQSNEASQEGGSSQSISQSNNAGNGNGNGNSNNNDDD
jgi:hypothetical protein